METKNKILLFLKSKRIKEKITSITGTFTDHGNEMENIISKKPPLIVRWGTVYFFFVLVLLGIISLFIQYPDIIKAKAKLISVNPTKEIFTPIDGKVVKMLVKDNENVNVGQVLGYMESNVNPPSVLHIKYQVDSAIVLVEQNKMKEVATSFKINPNQNIINKKIDLGELQESYQLLIQSCQSYRNYLSPIDYQNKKDIFLKALHTMGTKIRNWEKKYLLIAPISGTVSLNILLPENQETKAGQLVCYVIPTNTSFYVEMLVPQANFGKVKQGQQVLLKFQAYPFEQYGSVIGKIEKINAIPSDSGYFIKVILPQGPVTNYKKSIQFHDGLLAEADIITGNMRLTERFYYNIFKQIK